MRQNSAFFLILALLSCSSSGSEIDVRVVSTQPHLVSGGDALIEVVTSAASGADLRLTVNGEAQAVEFAATEAADGSPSYRALVSGLRIGENTIEVDMSGGAGRIAVINYPITGPIISGPHLEPYFCLSELAPDSIGEKRRFAIGNGEYLDDTSVDAFCSLPTRVDYVYRSATADGEFLPLPHGGERPADLATVSTIEGVEAPYIVRIETGTINRAIYQTAILHDPAGPAPSPLSPPAAWNGRLVYTYGGGCEAGFFQGTSTGRVLRDNLLSKGYAVASSTLNVNSQGGCNDVLSAETTMMVKEHFIETYGEPRYTIGNGGSGGAMQQLLIAGAYPGLLDGIMPTLTFSDAVTYFMDTQECSLPLRNFLNDESRGIKGDVKAAIGAWSMWFVCDESLGLRPDRIAPYDCPAQIPMAKRYDAVKNPDGVRCSIYDGMRNIFREKLFVDINSERTFARSPHDNVGVQYGLATLNEGIIDKTFFLDLNEAMGGWDIDFQPRSERTVADDNALRIAYETGRVTSGGAGLSQVPIIDDRRYMDHEGNFHASVYSFTTRARLMRDNGHADNYVIRRHPESVSLADENLALMDRWLANIKADGSDLRPLEKIVRSKPPELQDDCWTEAGERIVEKAIFDKDRLFDNTRGACNELYPPHGGLRLVAGGPLSNDVFKCQLKPIDYGDYSVEFTDAERGRLEAIFDEGVCDWSRPGVHQAVNQTWLSYGPSPVNRYQP
ncbi:MAG: hypothetical protein IIC36_01480 [Gemmatimonadetes bacterium]|nr:hypothetical protein [Gemmatimonadota bacterium]